MSLGQIIANWLSDLGEANGSTTPVGSFDGIHGFTRWAPFWPDEFITREGIHYYRPPWWRPFNLLVHRWEPAPGYGEVFHDHPRWSITVCLAGELIEETPWRSRRLRPGSVVIRGRKYIHRLIIPDGFAGRTWTLFIVGPRNWIQNDYEVTSRRGHKGQVRAAKLHAVLAREGEG
jgi:hypothetical protein